MKAEKGNIVTVEYTGTLEDGTVFDTSEGRAPLEFVLGKGELIKGFENAVLGMEVGEDKVVILEPKDAYGERNEKLEQTFPIEAFGPEFDAREGMVLTLEDRAGNLVRALVKEIKEKTVTLDLNHPLAGKTINFKIKLVDIKKHP